MILFLHVVHDKECLCGVGIATATSPPVIGTLNPNRALGHLSKSMLFASLRVFLCLLVEHFACAGSKA